MRAVNKKPIFTFGYTVDFVMKPMKSRDSNDSFPKFQERHAGAYHFPVAIHGSSFVFASCLST